MSLGTALHSILNAAVSSGKPSASLSQMPRGAGTTLLAEDEDGVRAAIRRVLESNGYILLAAQNGDEALTICQ